MRHGFYLRQDQIRQDSSQNNREVFCQPAFSLLKLGVVPSEKRYHIAENMKNVPL